MTRGPPPPSRGWHPPPLCGRRKGPLRRGFGLLPNGVAVVGAPHVDPAAGVTTDGAHAKTELVLDDRSAERASHFVADVAAAAHRGTFHARRTGVLRETRRRRDVAN